MHIFQLEGYMPERLLSWVFRNFTVREVGGKKPLVWTLRARFLYLFALIVTGSVPVTIWFVTENLFVTCLAAALLILQPYIQLTILAFLVEPYLWYEKNKLIINTQNKLRSNSSLKIIGITGSFGKTSVKEILYQILKTKYRILRTPKSYNTLAGIAKVIDLELDRNLDFFICEMAAYKKGDIGELVNIIHPQYGILTGITEQHFVRFGSLQSIIEGKFELINGLPEDGYALLNGDNEYIINRVKEQKIIRVKYALYGLEKDNQIRATALKYGEFGSEFYLNTPVGKKKVKTKLLGKSNVQNILASVGMALYLGMTVGEITRAIGNLFPIPNRLELINRDNLTMINDSFNSNPIGFREAVDVARSFNREYKVLVTPGVIELGEKTQEIHKGLGRYCSGVFSKVILIGHNPRTRGIEAGLIENKYNPNNIQFIKSINDAFGEITKVDKKNTVVLLENDLPDQYV